MHILLPVAVSIFLLGMLIFQIILFQIKKIRERHLETAIRAAEAASESKTIFLAKMSHEMRTPLNAIIGISELMLGKDLSGEDHANVEKVYTAGLNLLGLINDILDISKIEAGKFVLIPVVYDIASLINDTINLNIVRIGSKPIEFRLHVNGSLPAQLKGDELRVKEIFNNLLSNAFKYTDSGYVDWTISCTREGDRIRLSSTIADTGKGISKEDIEKLFTEAYFQTDLRANYYTEGTGLGLSITHSLIKLMDGSVSVQSDLGKGSVFTVEIYQEQAGDNVIGDEAAEKLSQFRYAVHRRSQNQKIVRMDMSYAAVLVVDDVPTNLEVAKGMLRPYGLKVDCVTSGAEAVKRITEEKTRYNAVFMDHMMPGMDGIETTRIIRKEIGSEYAKTIPIIALTANAVLGNETMFLENGFQAFLSKPIDILRMDNILNQWVRSKTKERELPQKLNAPAESAVTQGPKEESPANPVLLRDAHIPGLNIAEALERLEDDEETYLLILHSYTAHAPSFINTVRAEAQGDIDKYRIAVHAIKGSSRGIGAGELGNKAEKLENAAKQGDKAFIAEHTGPFIIEAEKFIEELGTLTQKLDSMPGRTKPEQEVPDPGLLREVLKACEEYDIVSLRKAIASMDSYSYLSWPGLSDWLREQADLSNFAEIQKKLADRNVTVS